MSGLKKVFLFVVVDLMPLYNIAFYSILFFLFGVLLANFKINLLIILFIIILTAVLLLTIGYIGKNNRFFWMSGFSLIIILGTFYCFSWNGRNIRNLNIIFDDKINFQGIVLEYLQTENLQKLVIQLQKPLAGKVSVNLPLYPKFEYGDLIEFNGAIKTAVPDKYREYLAAKNIFGTVDFPKTNLISENQGSIFMAKLLAFKDGIISNLQKTLSFEKAAFLSGIILGERAEFSKEFKEAMKKSGTTHIVALSGYNITILAMAVISFFSFIFNRQAAFYISIIVIISFVLMTGAEASVVRAAIMGGIVLLAVHIGRLHSIRNAIVVAAFLMALVNPNILRFDLGFQLSFFALLGIVYLEPAIGNFLKTKEERGFSGWRENLLSTISAQLMVMPILLLSSASFSLTSFLSNILILEAIPLIMFMGFLLAGVGFIFAPLAIIIAWFVDLLLSYEIIVINLFSKFSFAIVEMGIFSAMIYYLALIIFIYYYQQLQRNDINKFHI